MAVAFQPGDEVVRGDLDIFLTNALGPTNAAEITYALYYVDPGPPEAEVLIGSAARTPVNPLWVRILDIPKTQERFEEKIKIFGHFHKS